VLPLAQNSTIARPNGGGPGRAIASALVAVVALAGGAGAPGKPRDRRGLSIRAERVATPTPDMTWLDDGSLLPMSCRAGTLADGDVCVHLPDDDEGAPEAQSAQNEHHDPRGHWTAYDEIPRRSDRPSDYDSYRYPVRCDHNCVVSGFDLDRPDDLQRRGRRLRQVGHGAVDLPQRKGTPILMIALEHQQGDAEVVYVGPLFGMTVITRHALREAGQLRDYLLIFGHLDAQAPEVRTGVRLKEGDIVGFVGDTGSPDLVHLHLEARRMRPGVDATKLTPSAAIANENSVVCDPRNVLPLR
jgi:murein DD-endopeptidase MepM/ murein hydrolase activator NlpD